MSKNKLELSGKRFDGAPVDFLGEIVVKFIPLERGRYCWDVLRLCSSDVEEGEVNYDFEFYIVQLERGGTFDVVAWPYDVDPLGDVPPVCGIIECDTLEEALLLCAEFDAGQWNTSYITQEIK